MSRLKYVFSQSTVEVYFDQSIRTLSTVVDKEKAIIITDENIFLSHQNKFKGWNVITLKAGEEFKIQATVDAVVKQLIAFKADRKSVLVGVGGGVVTDLTGYIASIYMRGIKFGFVPASLLAMVDASIGGKNGIDVGEYKNMVGVIRQPSFLFYDLSLLKTLPDQEWSNGFAEIIKHGCILDSKLFGLLERTDLSKLKKRISVLKQVILTNVKIKAGIVKKDEFEQGDRKLLNFGHTVGHALETQYELTHGQAISLGMIFASWLSEKIHKFKDAERVEKTLVAFGLPTRANFDVKKVFGILQMDKKRVNTTMSFILLKRIGKGVITEIPVEDLYTYMAEFNSINKKYK